MNMVKALAAAILGVLLMAGCATSGERVLLEQRSAFGEIVVSEDAEGYRFMRFGHGGATQSIVKPGDPDHLDFAYTQAMPISLALVTQPKRVLVVGLGGGSVPMFLRHRAPDMYIDVVEIDPAVLAVAKSHFGFREDDHLHAYVADGRRYIETTTTRYDIVVLDAFGSEEVPYPLVTREFHEAVRRVLTAQGVVIGNIWARSSNRLYDSMLKTYEAVYGATGIVDLRDSVNRLVIGCAAATLPTKAEVVKRAAALTRALKLRNDLVPIVEHGLRPFGADSAGGRVLRDADLR